MSDFWTRRRAAVAAESQGARDDEARRAHEAEAALEAARPDEELLAEAGQPAPELLASPEQVRDFLQSALPQRLKTHALRRLWRLNPVLANIDGLVDYGEDFTDSANVVEHLATLYRVGQGMFAPDSAAEDAVEDVAAEEDAPAEMMAEMMAEAAPEDAPGDPAPAWNSGAPEAEGLPSAATGPSTESYTPSAPRRMRFSFDDPPERFA